MFKIFFRKRFVVGWVTKHTSQGELMFKSFTWKTSFKKKEEAKLWIYNTIYKPILFDRKTKCLIQTRNNIMIYLNKLKKEKK